MKKDFAKRIFESEQDNTYGELQAVPIKTIKNRYYILAVNIIGYLAAYLIIRKNLGAGREEMLWYVALPAFMDIFGIILFNIWANDPQNKEESYNGSMDYIIKGVVIYSFIYCDCVIVYHDVSEILIFLLIPSVIACFYKDTRWFFAQAVTQSIFFILFLLLRALKFPFHLENVPPALRILFFILGITQFAHALLGQDRMRLKMLRRSRELSAEEELQRSLAIKLGKECSDHIETIDGAVRDILKNGESNDIVKYVDHILEANELLKKAITDAEI